MKKSEHEALVERVDEYITWAARQWMEDNKLAIESTLRTEATTEFIESLKNVFVEHYIEIPDEKVDVVQALVAQVEELKKEKNDLAIKNMDLLKKQLLRRKRNEQ